MELAPHGPRDGTAQRRFAHAGRSHKAEDGAFGIRAQFADAQVFKDAILDLFQTKMIFIQKFSGFDDIQAIS